MYCKGVIAQIAVRRQVLGFMLVMENGDTEKYTKFCIFESEKGLYQV